MSGRRLTARLCGVAALVLLFAACDRPSGSTSAPAPQASDPIALARQAFDRKEWTAAAPLLRTAVARDSNSLEFHYKLAITASHLSLVDEAVTQFEWVVGNAAEGSEEMRMAREWLAAVKASGTTVSRGVESGAQPSTTANVADSRAGDSGISGTVRWAESGASPTAKQRMQVHLIALPGQQGVEEQRFTVRTDENGRYTFSKIPPGAYKLTNTVAGPPLWRLRVTIAPGRETTLDLDNTNSTTNRDDFPQG